MGRKELSIRSRIIVGGIVALFMILCITAIHATNNRRVHKQAQMDQFETEIVSAVQADDYDKFLDLLDANHDIMTASRLILRVSHNNENPGFGDRPVFIYCWTYAFETFEHLNHEEPSIKTTVDQKSLASVAIYREFTDDGAYLIYITHLNTPTDGSS